MQYDWFKNIKFYLSGAFWPTTSGVTNNFYIPLLFTALQLSVAHCSIASLSLSSSNFVVGEGNIPTSCVVVEGGFLFSKFSKNVEPKLKLDFSSRSLFFLARKSFRSVIELMEFLFALGFCCFFACDVVC